MSKIETKSKVSLNLPSRITSEGEARADLSTLDIAHKLPHSLERVNPRSKRTHRPQFPQEPLITSLPPAPQDRKNGYKWQSQPISKTETTSKAPLEPPSRIILGKRSARRAELSTLDTANNLHHSLKGLTPGQEEPIVPQ